MKHRNIPIFLPHLGCPYRCVFCDQNILTEHRVIPQPEKVSRIIADHLRTIESAAEIQVAFFGGNFTSLPFFLQMSYLDAVRPFLADGSVQGIRFSTRPDCLVAEELPLLRAKGVQVIELGIQSFSDRVLTASQREYTKETAIAAAQLIRTAGFSLGIQLMLGLPEDTPNLALEAAAITVALQPDMVRIYPTIVLTGTELAKRYNAGKYQPLTMQQAVEICKEMRLLFDRSGIPVIRVGLQASEELNDANQVLAGPYHPAFGELVEQSIFLDQALQLLKSCADLPEILALYVHPRDLSQLIGQHGSNRAALQGILNQPLTILPSTYLSERYWVGVGSAKDKTPRSILTRQEFLHTAY